mmetsp:Transcript_96608/g.216364  ORF Transcript_96608/g.216364 Transcript_96608/m.216364 type:complete len:265 (-) Transcript_96608:46-840(-)
MAARSWVCTSCNSASRASVTSMCSRLASSWLQAACSKSASRRRTLSRLASAAEEAATSWFRASWASPRACCSSALDDASSSARLACKDSAASSAPKVRGFSCSAAIAASARRTCSSNSVLRRLRSVYAVSAFTWAAVAERSTAKRSASALAREALTCSSEDLRLPCSAASSRARTLAASSSTVAVWSWALEPLSSVARSLDSACAALSLSRISCNSAVCATCVCCCFALMASARGPLGAISAPSGGAEAAAPCQEMRVGLGGQT